MVITTSPDLMTAEKIAGQLVENRDAACVQIVSGVKSYFRWEGKLDMSEEQLILIKTAADKYNEVENTVKKIHPYELPEIIAVPVSAGFSDYLDWINDNT